ncbi:hypothetical protein CSW23_07255 [Thermus scotoductus]|uniref:Uncharacterized protein n=1 Tax=Thermus scotoductus TaxID=37636 RepID=A0A430V1R2_THESC|nr:hypothetical protein CSW31_01120 [Thermus scotoductus]RTI16492.1 hypothetical protein CSW23_07255 [Thermus scotoductus]
MKDYTLFLPPSSLPRLRASFQGKPRVPIVCWRVPRGVSLQREKQAAIELTGVLGRLALARTSG